MRVAALYDVHGNLPALEAVLAEVPDDAVILVGGDVAMGPPGDSPMVVVGARGGRQVTAGPDCELPLRSFMNSWQRLARCESWLMTSSKNEAMSSRPAFLASRTYWP